MAARHHDASATGPSPVAEAAVGAGDLSIPLAGANLRVPRWLLRELGVVRQEVSIEGEALRAGDRVLPLGPVPEAPGAVRLGDLAYALDGSVIDLGALLSRPELWLGNDALRTFLGDETFASLPARRRADRGGLRLDARHWPAPPSDRLGTLLEAIEVAEPCFRSVHAAGELLRGERPEARRALLHLHLGLATEQAELAAHCRALLGRAAWAPDDEVCRRALRALLPAVDPGETVDTLRLFLDRPGRPALAMADLGDRDLGEAHLRPLLEHLASDGASAAPLQEADRRLLVGAMRLVVAWAVDRPAGFTRVRTPLARLAVHRDEEIAARAREELDRLRGAFWKWVGPNTRRSVDPVSGAPYGWSDVLVVDANVAPADAEHLLLAIEDSTLVRGSVFLLCGGALVSLPDLPPRGATIRLLWREHGKSVFRLSLRTRAGAEYDLAVNVADDMSFTEFRDEVAWLLAAGAPPALVEAFGGCFPEWGIFTEEFVAGETIEALAARLVRHGDASRLASMWPALVWTALGCHARFWNRTGRRFALRRPSPSAFVLSLGNRPAEARVVSVSDRAPCESVDELLDRFQVAFVEPIESSRPELRALADEALQLAAVVDGLGGEPGVEVLSRAARTSRRAAAIDRFLEGVRVEGLTPRRAWLAFQR